MNPLRGLRDLSARLREPATKTDIVLMTVAISVLVFLLAAFGVGRP